MGWLNPEDRFCWNDQWGHLAFVFFCFFRKTFLFFFIIFYSNLFNFIETVCSWKRRMSVEERLIIRLFGFSRDWETSRPDGRSSDPESIPGYTSYVKPFGSLGHIWTIQFIHKAPFPPFVSKLHLRLRNQNRAQCERPSAAEQSLWAMSGREANRLQRRWHCRNGAPAGQGQENGSIETTAGKRETSLSLRCGKGN